MTGHDKAGQDMTGQKQVSCFLRLLAMKVMTIVLEGVAAA